MGLIEFELKLTDLAVATSGAKSLRYMGRSREGKETKTSKRDTATSELTGGEQPDRKGHKEVKR